MPAFIHNHNCDTGIAIPSECLSVAHWYGIVPKWLSLFQNSFKILSMFDSPIDAVYLQLISVIKFERGRP